ncbi:MAG: hypothetical protein IJM44_04690 [Ruminococcus sp.]|nr:hypothetical protein [Ruminococcus sp.]
MEDFRRSLEKKVIKYRVFIVISLVGMLTLVIFGKHNDGFNATSGFFGGLCGVLAVQLIQTKKALRDDVRLKKMYIQSTDERNIQLVQKSSAAMFNIIVVGLGLATVVSNFFSSVVCCTLSVCLAFVFIVYGAVSAYYNRRM